MNKVLFIIIIIIIIVIVIIITVTFIVFTGALACEARAAGSGAPWVRKCGKLPI